MNILAKIWEAILTVLCGVFEVVGIVVTPLLCLPIALAELFFTIPVLGRALRQIWAVALEVAYRAASLLDALLDAIGLRPEKKLRISVIIQQDESGNPVMSDADATVRVQKAIDLFKDAANVRVIPMTWAHFSTPFGEKTTAGDAFLHQDGAKGDATVLDVSTNVAAWGEDLLLTGSRFHLLMIKHGIWGMARRFFGYGAPLTVIVVRTIGTVIGCSLGPLTDYVTITGGSGETTLAHELGHACGLWHDSDVNNILYPSETSTRTQLTGFQRVNFRNSKHVTYF